MEGLCVATATPRVIRCDEIDPMAAFQVRHVVKSAHCHFESRSVGTEKLG